MAILIFVAAVGVGDVVSNWLPNLPFLTFFIAALVTALIAGTGPALLVVAASIICVWTLHFSSDPQPKTDAPILALFTFGVLSCLVVGIVHLLNRKVESLLYERDRNEALLQDSAMGELQLEQLNVELRHRLKNTFAVISGLVSQSARHSKSIESFASALSGRLSAMGTAMDLVATRSFLGASLSDLVGDTLKPLVPPGQSRFTFGGADGIIPGDVANALALTLHELGTNAIKYGAWSNDTGAVSVTWTFDPVDEDDAHFVLLWKERGGPPVGQPQHRGLGSILIDSGFPSAKVTREFSPGGVDCRIEAVVRRPAQTTRRTRGRGAAMSSS
ncbi:HWE histidine kinase domain-containing protein [Hyphomicrobium methylovorum]|uniref:HWE histidine kinase domain-containing protein n=1 Tax=Hyphomicrobium methylovorum TaxID=84 RepID=UPI0031B56CA6